MHSGLMAMSTGTVKEVCGSSFGVNVLPLSIPHVCISGLGANAN